MLYIFLELWYMHSRVGSVKLNTQEKNTSLIQILYNKVQKNPDDLF